LFVFRFLFSVIIFIVITGRKADTEYMFIQWLSFSAQDENSDNGLNVFIYSLKALREHFMRNICLKNTLNKLFFCLILGERKGSII
jgi:hypothetical protein